MFPGQQCATCPAQLWPPRLGIKLLEGAPSTEKWRKGVYFRMASRKIGVISLVFALWVDRAQRGHINRTTPVYQNIPVKGSLSRYSELCVGPLADAVDHVHELTCGDHEVCAARARARCTLCVGRN